MKHPNVHCNIGSLKPGGKGRHATHKRVELEVPQRITNASSTQPYAGVRWNIRSGGEQHEQFKSLGLGT